MKTGEIKMMPVARHNAILLEYRAQNINLMRERNELPEEIERLKEVTP